MSKHGNQGSATVRPARAMAGAHPSCVHQGPWTNRLSSKSPSAGLHSQASTLHGTPGQSTDDATFPLTPAPCGTTSMFSEWWTAFAVSLVNHPAVPRRGLHSQRPLPRQRGSGGRCGGTQNFKPGCYGMTPLSRRREGSVPSSDDVLRLFHCPKLA